MTKRNSLLRKMWIVVCAAALLGAAGHALADHKNVSALLCKEEGDATPDIAYTYSGGAQNIGASTLSLICPTVRDDVTSTMDVNDWDIAYDRHGASGIWQVVLWSLNQSATSGFTSVITLPASPSSGWNTADGAPITSAYANAPMAVTSQLPPDAELLWYEIDETGVTDN
jgi:hypothetical protein